MHKGNNLWSNFILILLIFCIAGIFFIRNQSRQSNPCCTRKHSLHIACKSTWSARGGLLTCSSPYKFYHQYLHRIHHRLFHPLSITTKLIPIIIPWLSFMVYSIQGKNVNAVVFYMHIGISGQLKNARNIGMTGHWDELHCDDISCMFWASPRCIFTTNAPSADTTDPFYTPVALQ